MLVQSFGPGVRVAAADGVSVSRMVAVAAGESGLGVLAGAPESQAAEAASRNSSENAAAFLVVLVAELVFTPASNLRPGSGRAR
jgi:hypothetical protein